MVKTPTKNLIFTYQAVNFESMFFLPCSCLFLTTAGLTGIFQVRLGQICLNSVMLNLVKSGNRIVIVILRDALMFKPVNIALPRWGSANQAVVSHHLLDKGGRLNLMKWSITVNWSSCLILATFLGVFLCHLHLLCIVVHYAIVFCLY